MSTEVSLLKKGLSGRLLENVVIREYVTTAVGGIVDYLTVCESVMELVEAIKAARMAGLPYIIIGCGSNVLFSDIGFPGLVIVNQTNKISFIPDKSQVIVESGVLMSKLIMETASRDLTGLEFLFGLRGTVAGAVVNNRQANGVAIGNLVKGVTFLMPDGQIEHVAGGWMDFEPFGSRLIRCRANDPTAILPAILTVTFQLSRNKKEEILRKIQHFGQLNNRLWPLTEPSLGPIFKDPSHEQSAEAFLDGIKFKKVKIGRARIFARNPNFILTHERGLGAGKTADIATLVRLMKEKVLEMYGYELEEAFEYVGSWSEIISPIEYE